MVKYTFEQWTFLYDSYVKKISYKSCKRRFHHGYVGVSTLKNKYLNSINLRQTSKVPLHNQKIGVVCHYCCKTVGAILP
jgi:hypothetical protein